MKYKVTAHALGEIKADCICLPLLKKGKLSQLGREFDTLCDGQLSQNIKDYGAEAKVGASCAFNISGQNIKRVILLGADTDKLSQSDINKIASSLAGSLKGTNIKHLAIALDLNFNAEASEEQLTKQVILANESGRYCFDLYKSEKSPKPALQQISFKTQKQQQAPLKQAVAFAQALATGMSKTKDLGNQPGNVCTPTFLADEAKSLAKQADNFSVKILEEKDMEKLNMGAFLSVSKGSTEPGKLIVIEYKGGAKSEAPHVLVGKGITFDTGGISLKPGAQMDEMKYDMCGAASVMGVMTALSEIKPKMNVIGVIAAAENMPAGNASKPGDIVSTASGQTVEILNTDAEGRLVLCDALTYVERFKPASVVDIATLTGACIIALGHCTSAVMSNDDALANELLEAGKRAADKAWQLPIWDEYQSQLDSPFADMQNIGGKGAGSITAACFLSRFTKKYKWAHLDIAGTAWVSGGKDKGATGRPVPLLLEYLMSKQAK